MTLNLHSGGELVEYDALRQLITPPTADFFNKIRRFRSFAGPRSGRRVSPELLFMIVLPRELFGRKADDQVPCEPAVTMCV